MEKLFEMLQNTDLLARADYGCDSILKEFAGCLNTYSFDTKGFLERVEQDKKSRKNLLLLSAMTGVCLGYSWWCDENRECIAPHWDRRKEAAESFCFHNWQSFQDLYEKLSGSAVRRVDMEDAKFCMTHDLCFGSRATYLDREVGALANMHPTLVQKMVGVMYEFLSRETKIQFLPPLNYDRVVFPLI